jgi:hypothetical protein
MKHVGDHGIVDYDGGWEAQSMKYECEGKHTLFITDTEALFDPYEVAFNAADAAILSELRSAKWDPNPTKPSVQLRVGSAGATTIYGEELTSLENLRSELAYAAVAAFHKTLTDNKVDTSKDPVEYEFIHGIEDVDEALEMDEWALKLKELQWDVPRSPKT